jgi:hypothetical protein
MHHTCYLRNGTVYVPTVGKRGAVYVTMEPVAVVPVTDSEGLGRAFAETIGKGNPPLPLVKGEWPPPIMLKYTKTKSWSAFVRSTLTWSIGVIDDRPQIAGYLLRPDGSLEEDHDHKIKFPAGTDMAVVIDRLIAILQEAARNNTQPVIVERPPRSLPPLPEALLAGARDWVRLPPGPERIDELADFIEWMANAEPKDEQIIRAEIKRYYYDVGAQASAAALNSAFTALLKPGLTKEARQSILDQLEVFTRTDPAENPDPPSGAGKWIQ